MLSHSHFKVVTSESRGHLKAQPEISREFGFIFWISSGYSVLGFWDARVTVCKGYRVVGFWDARV